MTTVINLCAALLQTQADGLKPFMVTIVGHRDPTIARFTLRRDNTGRALSAFRVRLQQNAHGVQNLGVLDMGSSSPANTEFTAEPDANHASFRCYGFETYGCRDDSGVYDKSRRYRTYTTRGTATISIARSQDFAVDVDIDFVPDPKLRTTWLAAKAPAGRVAHFTVDCTTIDFKLPNASGELQTAGTTVNTPTGTPPDIIDVPPGEGEMPAPDVTPAPATGAPQNPADAAPTDSGSPAGKNVAEVPPDWLKANEQVQTLGSQAAAALDQTGQANLKVSQTVNQFLANLSQKTQYSADEVKAMLMQINGAFSQASSMVTQAQGLFMQSRQSANNFLGLLKQQAIDLQTTVRSFGKGVTVPTSLKPLLPTVASPDVQPTHPAAKPQTRAVTAAKPAPKKVVKKTKTKKPVKPKPTTVKK